MAAVKFHSIKAFSLFESVVAISIISVLVAIGTTIYGNLLNAERPLAFYQAKEEIDRLYHEMKSTRAFFSRSYENENYRVDQKVEFHEGNKRLYVVEFSVFAQNKHWWTEKHLLANDESR